MLLAIDHAVPSPQRERCERLIADCAPEQLQRISSRVSAWIGLVTHDAYADVHEANEWPAMCTSQIHLPDWPFEAKCRSAARGARFSIKLSGCLDDIANPPSPE